jgi:hypothetical protein
MEMRESDLEKRNLPPPSHLTKTTLTFLTEEIGSHLINFQI